MNETQKKIAYVLAIQHWCNKDGQSAYPNLSARQEYNIGTATKLNFTVQNSYEMVSLNNICYLKSAEIGNFNTVYILHMFTLIAH